MLLYVLIITVSVLVAAYVAMRIGYDKVFINKQKDIINKLSAPDKKQYARYAKEVKDEYDRAESIAYENVYINSYDKKRLHAKYYRKDGASCAVILVHGYKSTALRDLCFALNFLHNINVNILLIDLRGHGLSDGKTLTMGVKESRDIAVWTQWLKDCGNEKIILFGISMGAAASLMSLKYCSVDGVIADCPFSSALSAFEFNAKKHNASKFSVRLLSMAAIVCGGFSIKNADACEAIKGKETPILLIYGKNDSVVSPSEKNKIAGSASSCKTVLFDAGHAVSYYSDSERYKKETFDFIAETFGNDVMS